MIASEVNRLHKILNDSGIRLSLVFSNLQSVSAWGVIDSIINQDPISVIITKLKVEVVIKLKIL